MRRLINSKEWVTRVKLGHPKSLAWRIAAEGGGAVRCSNGCVMMADIALDDLPRDTTVVVCAGGGGIPVIYKPDGELRPRPAVIDKDAASCLLATELGATHFILSTDVDKVALNFGTDNEVEIDRMTVAECRKHLAAGHFAAGSMKPKIESAIRFLEQGGEEVIITQPHLLAAAIQGRAGTHIVP